MTSKRKKKIKFSTFSILFIVLPILAVVIGFFGTEILLNILDKPIIESEVTKTEEEVLVEQPVEVLIKPDPKEVVNDALSDTPNDQSSEDDKLTQRITLPMITIHGMQLGSFASFDNSEKLMQDLAKKGVPSIVTTKSTYKVLSISSTSRQSIEKAIASTDWDGANYFITSFTFNPILENIDSSVNKESILLVCEGLKNIYDRQAEFSTSLSYKESDLVKVNDYGDELMKQIVEVRSNLDALTSSEIEEFSSVTYAILDELTTYASILQNTKSVDLDSVWNVYLTALFGYEQLGK